MTTARAIQPNARPTAGGAVAGGAPARRRPALRVVDTRRDGTRRSVAGLAGTVLATVLFASVFSVVTCQVLLVSAQSRLDEVNSSIDGQTGTGKNLQRDIEGLQSPERIVREATENLNMVAPTDVANLSPGADDDQRSALGADDAIAGEAGNESRAATGEGVSGR
jgi:cell division protein FtsL